MILGVSGLSQPQVTVIHWERRRSFALGRRPAGAVGGPAEPEAGANHRSSDPYLGVVREPGKSKGDAGWIRGQSTRRRFIGVPTGARNTGTGAPTGDQSAGINRTPKPP